MWQTSDTRADWLQSKHIYMGEERIVTKYNSEGNNNTQAERERTYYYHSDHLGSAQTITNWRGQIHERLEYTPYGELWIDWKTTGDGDITPFRFTGKEYDQETGLYYYGARYLDPKVSRWLSGDPAVYQGDYIPGAPVNDEARRRNQNLPGMGGFYNTLNLHTYAYTHNNPIRYIDPDGRRPSADIDSDLQLAPWEIEILNWRSIEFDTIDKAAIDFVGKYNDYSILIDREITTTIHRTDSGKYSYAVPRIGERRDSVGYYGGDIVANVHTHARATGTGLLPSPEDRRGVAQSQTIQYIVNQLGDIMRLSPSSNNSNEVDFKFIGNITPSLSTRTITERNFMIPQSEYSRILRR